jgi:integrase
MAEMTTAGYSPSWVCKAYRLFSQIMKAAADLITKSPCRGYRLPRLPEPAPRILTMDEVERLIDSSGRPFDLIILRLASSGIRIGEALTLRRGDVLDGGVLMVVDERRPSRMGASTSTLRSRTRSGG